MMFFDISSDPAHDLYGPGNSAAAAATINTKDELLEGSHVHKTTVGKRADKWA